MTQLNIQTNDAVEQLKLINEQLAAMLQNQQSVAQSSAQAAAEQESWFSKMKGGAGKIISNYMNIVAVIGDISEAVSEAYKRQERWTRLIESESYASYKNQVDGISEATKGLNDAYKDTESLQKLFASGVDLSGEKLTNLTQISAEYARKMGVDASNALQRFSEAIAESSVSKLEDLGLYISSEEAILNYAISIGKAVKELSDLEKKEATLQAILKEGEKANLNRAQNIQGVVSSLDSKFQQYKDKALTTLGDMASEFIQSSLEQQKTLVVTMGYVYDQVTTDNATRTWSKYSEIVSENLNNAMKSVKTFYNDFINRGSGLRQAVLSFQGAAANNMDAINKLQKEYEASWKKAEELEKKINSAKFKRLEKQYNDNIAIAKQSSETINNFMQGEEINLDDIFEPTEIMKRTQALQDIENSFSNNKIDLKKREHELLLQEEKDYNEKIKSFVFEGAQSLYQGLISGRENFLLETAALLMQKAGAEIFNDGIAGLWQGGRMMLSPWPTWQAQGAAMVGYSLAEVGAGLALGYAGTQVVPNLGSSSKSKDDNKSLAAADRAMNKENKQQVSVYLYPQEKYWLRSLNQGNKALGAK